jgi:hypothetical protein
MRHTPHQFGELFPLDRLAADTAKIGELQPERTYKTIKTWFCRFCRCLPGPSGNIRPIEQRLESEFGTALWSRGTPDSTLTVPPGARD